MAVRSGSADYSGRSGCVAGRSDVAEFARQGGVEMATQVGGQCTKQQHGLGCLLFVACGLGGGSVLVFVLTCFKHMFSLYSIY